MEEQKIEVQFMDRIKHTFSRHRTNDEELAYALTIVEMVERIEVRTADDTTTVEVYTDQGVYHFDTFRADYVGHASRTLVQALEHFGIRLPISFVTSHQTFSVYMGTKVVAREKEYPIALRGDFYELVEPIPSDWLISSAILDVLVELAKRFDTHPIEVAESATGLFYSILELADEYQLTPDEVVSAVTSLAVRNREEVAASHEDTPSLPH